MIPHKSANICFLYEGYNPALSCSLGSEVTKQKPAGTITFQGVRLCSNTE